MKTVFLSVYAAVSAFFAGCAQHDTAGSPVLSGSQMSEIQYISADLDNAIVFANRSARAGSILALDRGGWPSLPLERIETGDDVQCVSIGPLGNSTEFAIRRPITAEDSYTCRNSVFHVARCAADCETAIIEIDIPLSGPNPHGFRRAYMYVDRCVGLVIYSQRGDLSESIPFDALWLRGDVGILADPNYPHCE